MRLCSLSSPGSPLLALLLIELSAVDAALLELYRAPVMGPCRGIWTNAAGNVVVAATTGASCIDCTAGRASCGDVSNFIIPFLSEILSVTDAGVNYAAHAYNYFGHHTGNVGFHFGLNYSLATDVLEGRCPAVTQVGGTLFSTCEDGNCLVSTVSPNGANLYYASCSSDKPTCQLYTPGYMYIGLGAGFDVFDVSNTSNLILVATYGTKQTYDMAFSTDLTLAVATNDGIDFYDASNPRVPVSLTRLATTNPVTAVEYDAELSVFYYSDGPEIRDVTLSSVQAASPVARWLTSLTTSSAEMVYFDSTLHVCDGSEIALYHTTFTLPPETQVPSLAPATDAPATNAPATESPATDAPATDAPATDAPATESPA
ncbi:hypothetical protein DIPPA_54813, partial [Diplonema papillatum]